MGGPQARVLRRSVLTKHQEDELELWLRSVTNHLEKNKWGYQFWWNKDVFPGTISRCCFSLSIGSSSEYWDDDEIRQIKEQLGFLPEQSIAVSSGCNRDDDHATLSQAILYLAKVYDGLIDMAGAITPPLTPVQRESSLDEISAYVRAMPGRVYEIEYTVTADCRYVYHIVDVAFLEAWMEHPNFHMIK